VLPDLLLPQLLPLMMIPPAAVHILVAGPLLMD
jgi:hypothetical protein